MLVDMRKPHLYPPVLPVMRLTHFATAADVDTVIVDGRVLMERRQIEHLHSEEILEDAATQTTLAFERAGRAGQRFEGADIWRHSRRSVGAYAPAGSRP